jgi:hypothetical protein
MILPARGKRLMDELIKNLEIRLKALISRHAHLENVNDELLESKHMLASKQEKAIDQVKQLLAKLKTIEADV